MVLDLLADMIGSFHFGYLHALNSQPVSTSSFFQKDGNWSACVCVNVFVCVCVFACVVFLSFGLLIYLILLWAGNEMSNTNQSQQLAVVQLQIVTTGPLPNHGTQGWTLEGKDIETPQEGTVGRLTLIHSDCIDWCLLAQ